MRHPPEVSIKRFLPAILLGLITAAMAPFVGLLRDVLFATFQHGAVKGMSLGFAALGVVLVGVALVRIRQRRWLRYGGLLASAALVWVQAVGFKTDLAQVNVVEKVHLVQFGLLALLLYRACLPDATDQDSDASQTAGLGLFLIPMLWVTVFGTLDEGVQWLVETRTGEIRDVLLNILSGACGLLFAFSLQPPERFVWKLRRPRPVLLSGAVATAVVGVFFHVAHLGYMIEDPEIGRFRSWHSLEDLVETAEARRQRWQTDPPGDISPWNRQDDFLTEAGWHNHHRNASYDLELDVWALQANRILEKYYTPYLDLETFRQTGNRRFPPHAVERVEKAAVHVDPATYVSPVLESRIYTWPSKPAFLVFLVLAVATWLVPWFRLGRR